MPKGDNRDVELSERVAVLETDKDNMETRLQDIEGRIEAWDKFILGALLKFTTRLLFLLGIGGLMGGNLKVIKQWIVERLSW